MHAPIFTDRREAGRRLAEEILKLAPERPLVLGLSRGGVPVAYETARALQAPLDTIVVRKIGAPGDPEYAVGAIAPGDVIIYDDAALRALGLSRRDLDPALARALDEMDRRMTQYRSGDWTPDEPVGTAIIIDDGLATGLTARAAIESARLLAKPRSVAFAAPIARKGAATSVRDVVDAAIFLVEPDDLGSVGEWYEDFAQVSDDEVLECLERAEAKERDASIPRPHAL